jgi:hypothetical protein
MIATDDLMQLIVFGFSTGFGTAMGTLLAGRIINALDKRAQQAKELLKNKMGEHKEND